MRVCTAWNLVLVLGSNSKALFSSFLHAVKYLFTFCDSFIRKKKNIYTCPSLQVGT